MEKIVCIDGARYILRDSENDLDKDVYIFGSEDGKAFKVEMQRGTYIKISRFSLSGTEQPYTDATEKHILTSDMLNGIAKIWNGLGGIP